MGSSKRKPKSYRHKTLIKGPACIEFIKSTGVWYKIQNHEKQQEGLSLKFHFSQTLSQVRTKWIFSEMGLENEQEKLENNPQTLLI